MSGTLSTRNKAKMTGLDSAKPPKGSILVHLLALSVMGFVVTAHGKLPEVSAVQNDTPNAPPAFYILGDSSVDCGDNTLFYPLVHSFLSLYSCNGSSDASLIPHLLGNSYYSRSVSFLSFFLSWFRMWCSVSWTSISSQFSSNLCWAFFWFDLIQLSWELDCIFLVGIENPSLSCQNPYKY